MNTYLISLSDLKEIALINNNVEDSILRVTLQRVQRYRVKPVITAPLYDRLIEGIENEDLNTDEIKLIEEYIAPFIAVECDRKAINHTTYQIRNKTTGKGTDENITAVNESENLRLDNDVRSDIFSAEQELIDFLRENAVKYPQYKCPVKRKATVNNISFI
jgi:hypothetical protein